MHAQLGMSDKYADAVKAIQDGVRTFPRQRIYAHCWSVPL